MPQTQVPSLPADLTDLIGRVVHPRHGLITRLHEDPEGAQVGLRLVHANLASPLYFRKNAPQAGRAPDCGSGASFDGERAYRAAIGEALERYSASIFWPDQLTWAPEGALQIPPVDLSPLIRVARPEVHDYSPQIARHWVAGRDLADGERRMVPAALAFLAYEPDDRREIIAQSDSTGLACGTSFDDACLRALCELIERDTFASTWLLQRRPPRIAFSPDERARMPQAVRRAIDHPLFQMAFFHLGRPFDVHVIASLTWSADGIGVVAASASPSVAHAVEKAAAEGLHAWFSAGRQVGQAMVASPAAFRSPADHARYYLSPDRFQVVSRIFGEAGSIDYGDLREMADAPTSAADLARRLQARGFQATGLDLTSPDVEDLGFRVVRAVVPGLQPLVFGPACVEVRDRRRLDQWRATWQLPDAPFNPHPHPFP